MRVAYPQDIDSFVPLQTEEHNRFQRNVDKASLQDSFVAIQALESFVGIRGSLDTTTHDYRISSVEKNLNSAIADINVLKKSGGSATIAVQEADASPNVSSVSRIVFPNGSVTDDGGGQITVTFPSAPQDLSISASPTFAGATLSGLTSTALLWNASGVISSSSNLVYDNTNSIVKGKNIYLDSSSSYTDRGAMLTISRYPVTAPSSGVIFGEYILTGSAGDGGTTFKGHGGLYIATIEQTGQPRGVLYGLNVSIRPSTENSPYTSNMDSSCLVLDNDGTTQGTDVIYIGRAGGGGVSTTAANPDGYAWMTGITIERDIYIMYRAVGKSNIGLDLSTITATGTDPLAVKTLNGATSQFGIIRGGTASAGTITISTTSHTTKGKVLFGTIAALNEATVSFGLGTQSPTPLNTDGRVMHIWSSSASNIPELLIENTATSGVADLNLLGKTGSTVVRGRMVVSSGGEVDFGTVTNHQLVFITNNTARITIGNSGAIVINTDNGIMYRATGVVGNVTVSAPLTFSSGTLSITQSSGSVDGYLSSTDWTTFNAKESALTFSTGLTRATNTITANLSVGVSGGQSVIGGTNTTDALTFKTSTGNTTTGSDFIWVAGNNGATELMRLVNAGYIGLMTSAPNLTPYVAGSGVLSLFSNTTTNARGALEIGSNQTLVDGTIIGDVGFFGIPNSSGQRVALLRVAMSGSTSNNRGAEMRFFTKSDAGSLSQRVVLDSNGNLGIGDSSPAYMLTVGSGDLFGVNSSGIIAKYNNVATVGGGVPSLIATVGLTAQSAAITATTIYAVPAAGAGVYRVSFIAKVTTAASTSSVLGGTNGFQVKYTDKDDSVVVTTGMITNVSGTALNLNTTQAVYLGSVIVSAKASTNIQYLIDYTSIGVTAMQYNLYIRVERLDG